MPLIFDYVHSLRNLVDHGSFISHRTGKSRSRSLPIPVCQLRAARVLPSAWFLVYLGFHATRNLKKLSHRRSYVRMGYDGILWFAALVNIAWGFLQGSLGVTGKVATNGFKPWKQPLACKRRLHTINPYRSSLPRTLCIVGALVHRAALLLWSAFSSVSMLWNVIGSLSFLGGYLSLFAVKTDRRKRVCIRFWNLSYLLYRAAMVYVWQCTLGKQVAWNLLSLFGTSAMLFLEISIVAFLLKENYASSLESLARTFMVSGLFVGVDLLLKVGYNTSRNRCARERVRQIIHGAWLGCLSRSLVYWFLIITRVIFVFGFGVPLFLDVEIADRLFVHFSKWRDRLPPRLAFYNYVIVMFAATAVMLFACGLAGIKGGFGLWLYNLAVVCYHSLYLSFLYVTFLADFFKEEDWLLDSAYYSEMKDAGFFDAGWE